MKKNSNISRILSLRKQFGLSQEGFARKLGVSFTTVNRWESGKSAPSQLAKKILRQLEEELKKNENHSL